MGPSEKAFHQVKSILGKLDRNIDQLREQRTAPPAPAVATHARVEPPKPAAPAPAPVPYRSVSGFGRATPITPTNN